MMLFSNSIKLFTYAVRDVVDYIVHKGWKVWKGFGILIYIGMFGTGKTLSAVRYVINQAKQYNLHVYSNIKLNGIEYTELKNFKDIIDAPPDSIFLIDEISTLFNARDWKNFSIDLLFQILQCRKNRKQLVCTAQRFQHVDKLLRDVTSEVVVCSKTWRFCHNQYYDAYDYENVSNGRLIKRIANVWYFATNAHYNAYDTSELIDNFKKAEFVSNEEVRDKRYAGAGTTAAHNANVNKKYTKKYT